MQKIINFWRKDRINKVIVINGILLLIGIIALYILIIKMPEGKTVNGMVGDLFPTRTIEPRVIMTQNAEKAIIAEYMATASAPPTITTMPLSKLVKSATPFAESTLLVIEEPATETLTLLPTIQLPSTATLPVPTITKQSATPTGIQKSPTAAQKSTTSTATVLANVPIVSSTPAASSLGASCIPNNKPQNGKVLSVLDGITLRVMIEGKTYNVRLIGLELPVNKNFKLMSGVVGGSMLFGLDIQLFKDKTEKDDSGYLVRYVKQGGTFINLEMLKRGLATTIDSAPNNACESLFRQAEDDARAKDIGLWLLHPTVTKP